jgi:S-adenosylmethionine synthetase
MSDNLEKAQTDLKETIKPKNVKSGTEKDKKSKDKSKSKVSSETMKKTYKVVIRKLPIRDFSNDDFRANVSRVLLQLGYDCPNSDAENELIQIEHFIEGKLRYITL